MVSRGAIAVLDENTIAQIAAGEVVERPLSVVKELVENAIDAGATRIAVSLVRGGLDRIEVADDGSGIARADLPLAPLRHATSKLHSADGLERIATLGFRGEGLAAIAAVANVRLLSRTRDDEVAHAIEIGGGAIGPAEPAAGPPGTRVVVSDLFGSVPARREFLRGPAAEGARISAFLSTLALAYPEIAFVLRHDGREVFALESGAADARLAHVFGEGWSRLIPIEPRENAHARVTGFVSAPGSDRGDRRAQVAFVNARLLRTTQFAGAWSAAYATYAMQQRHAFGVLHVDVPPVEVDPNVHPTKFDVRLRRASDVTDTVRRAIARTLAAYERARFSAAVAFPAGPGSETEPAAAAVLQPSLIEVTAEQRSTLRIVAQIDRTYIIATDGAGIVAIDQHAAHERIAFEEIARRYRSGVPGSPLLVPDIVEFDAETAARFEAARETLAEAGLHAEPFGERAFRIVATPAGYGSRRFDLRGLLDDLSDAIPGLDARERAWASIACHSVARAGETLEAEEMATLVARLQQCENPMHCPHGRPTMVRLGADEFARLFKRV
jgi:DNA mismatch repair protein MutL